jgi:hypothetical protein
VFIKLLFVVNNSKRIKDEKDTPTQLFERLEETLKEADRTSMRSLAVILYHSPLAAA